MRHASDTISPRGAVHVCSPSILLKLSTDGSGITSAGRSLQMGATRNEKKWELIRLLYDMKPFRISLEERGDDVLIICCWGSMAYLICCTPLSYHLSFFCSSANIIPGFCSLFMWDLRFRLITQSAVCLCTWSKKFILLPKLQITLLEENWGRISVKGFSALC